MLEIQNKLVCSTSDVKDVFVTDDYVIVGGREGVIHLYDKSYNLLLQFKPDSGAVNSLEFDGKNVYAGCQNGSIHVYDTTNTETARLVGHTGNVCCLRLRKSILLSGSWDHTVRVWDISKKVNITSIDHPGTVWCVCFIEDDSFVTGCADKVIRFYKNNCLEKTMNLHNFCIRSLYIKNDILFSIDNEGTLLKTSLSGDLLNHTSFKDFMYSIIPLDDRVLCCGENGKTYILNNNLHVIGETEIPCTSCWRAVVYKGTIYICGSDGCLYTLKCTEKTEDLINKNYLKNEKKQSVKEFTSNNQKYKVIDNNVFQFIDNEWVPIGEHVDTFDYSFNVELEGKYYELAFNKKDNIFEVADKFLKTHKLNEEYKQEIVDFIKQNFKQGDFRTYEAINVDGVRKALAKYNNLRFIFRNISKRNKEENRELEEELVRLLETGPKFVTLDLYRFFIVHGFEFDLTFLLQFNAADKKEALAFIRLVTVLYADPPFNLEVLFPVFQKLRDIGYLQDGDLDDYLHNRSIRNLMQSKNY